MNLFDIERMIRQLQTRLQNLVQPSQQLEDTTEHATATTKLGYVGTGVASGVPLLQQYGVYSRPLANAIHTVLNIGGLVGRGVSIASNDERYRPVDLAPGDVCLADSSGQRIQLAGGISISIIAGQTISITAPTGITITSPQVTINGSVVVTGDVVASGKSLVHHTHRSFGSNSVTTAPL